MCRRPRSGHEEGAAATEFALIAPLLIVLFFGIVQFGIATYRIQVIEASAREAARVASVGFGAADVEEAAENAAPGFTSAEVTSTIEDVCDEAGDDVTVRVVATDAGGRLDVTVPFFGSFTPTFSAEATFRCEAETP